MKNSELISMLSQYDGELEVTTSDNCGSFSCIDDVVMERWSDGSFASVTLLLSRYDNSKCIVDDEKLTESRADNEFLDNVNKDCGGKIDKKESLASKSVFTDDFNEYSDKVRAGIESVYTKILQESMNELFGSITPLEMYSDKELEDAMKMVGYDYNLSERVSKLKLLYSKLNEKIKEKLLEQKIGLTF